MLVASRSTGAGSADRAQSARLTRRAVHICIATTLVVAALELSIGSIFNLISVFAEGLHTAADLADSVGIHVIHLAMNPQIYDGLLELVSQLEYCILFAAITVCCIVDDKDEFASIRLLELRQYNAD